MHAVCSLAPLLRLRRSRSQGLKDAEVQPEGAYYHPELREFILPYEAVRSAPSPDAALAAFIYSTYDRAATLAGWDRDALERPASVMSR